MKSFRVGPIASLVSLIFCTSLSAPRQDHRGQARVEWAHSGRELFYVSDYPAGGTQHEEFEVETAR